MDGTFRKVEVMDLSDGTLLALAPVVVLVVGLVVFCLVDLIRAPTVRYLPKLLWALIILVGSTPVGAIAYLVLGRERQPASSIPATTGRPVTTNDAGTGPAPGAHQPLGQQG